MSTAPAGIVEVLTYIKANAYLYAEPHTVGLTCQSLESYVWSFGMSVSDALIHMVAPLPMHNRKPTPRHRTVGRVLHDIAVRLEVELDVPAFVCTACHNRTEVRPREVFL